MKSDWRKAPRCRGFTMQPWAFTSGDRQHSSERRRATSTPWSGAMAGAEVCKRLEAADAASVAGLREEEGALCSAALLSCGAMAVVTWRAWRLADRR